jgi:hypothetical protein
MIRRRTRPRSLPIARLGNASRQQRLRRRRQPFDPIERHPNILRLTQQPVFGNEPAHHPRDRVLRDPHRRRRNRYPLLHRNPHNHIMTAGCDNYARDRAVGFGPPPRRPAAPIAAVEDQLCQSIQLPCGWTNARSVASRSPPSNTDEAEQARLHPLHVRRRIDAGEEIDDARTLAARSTAPRGDYESRAVSCSIASPARAARRSACGAAVSLAETAATCARSSDRFAVFRARRPARRLR